MRINGKIVGVVSAFLMIFYLSGADILYSDTVVLTNGERLKGVIVEEYRDRVTLSTMDGERNVMRQGIKNIIFDLEEQNLTNLGDFYQDRALYEKAYYYYSRALEINPDYKKARDSLNYVGTFIQQSGRMRKLDHIKRLNEESRWGRKSGISVQPEISGKELSAAEKIRGSLGFTLKSVRHIFEISDIVPGSPADKAGVRGGDILLAAWGRSVSYMEPEAVFKKLVSPGVMDIKITVERKYLLDLRDAKWGAEDTLGAKLGFTEMEGLVIGEVAAGSVAETSGLKSGDRINRIQGESTRYMSLEDVRHIINSRKGDILSLTIKRDIVIWKKFNLKEGQ